MFKNSEKKWFKKYNFSKIKNIIKTLKVKKNFISGNIIKGFIELFKAPFNLNSIKYVYLLILPKKTIKKDLIYG